MAHFRVRLLRLPFTVQRPIHFPAAFAANVFRGALGTRLPRKFFAPPSALNAPSGLAEPPRPFVLRARHLDGLILAEGETFLLQLNLFAPFADAIVPAFREAHPFHGAVRLTGAPSETELTLSLAPGEETCTARVLFLTPTELKHEDGLASVPHFAILFARAVSRLRTLAALYGKPLTLDFESLAEQANRVELVQHSLTHEWAERVSTRTGQTHPLGGFTGHADYQGDLRELLPILHAAQYTGVGRQTVWGKGEIQVASQPEPG